MAGLHISQTTIACSKDCLCVSQKPCIQRKQVVKFSKIDETYNKSRPCSPNRLQPCRIQLRGRVADFQNNDSWDRVTFSRIVRRAPNMVVTQVTEMIPGIPGSCAASAHHFASYFRSSICSLLVNPVSRW